MPGEPSGFDDPDVAGYVDELHEKVRTLQRQLAEAQAEIKRLRAMYVDLETD